MNTQTQKSSASKVITIIVGMVLSLVWCNVVFTSDEQLNQSSSSQTIIEEEPSVELKGLVRGLVKSEHDYLNGVEIAVYEEDGNSMFSSNLTNWMGRAKIMLPLNRQFTLVFSKPGYSSKSISVDTHVNGNTIENYNCNYNITLFENNKVLKANNLNESEALISFNKKSAKFKYYQKYTSQENEEIKKMYASILN